MDNLTFGYNWIKSKHFAFSIFIISSFLWAFLMCTLKPVLEEKVLSQKSHLTRIPSWMFFKCAVLAQIHCPFPHLSHHNRLSRFSFQKSLSSKTHSSFYTQCKKVVVFETYEKFSKNKFTPVRIWLDIDLALRKLTVSFVQEILFHL